MPHVAQEDWLEIFAHRSGVVAWIWNFEDGSFSAMNYLYTMLDLNPMEYPANETNIVQLLQPGLSSTQYNELLDAISLMKENREPFELALFWKTPDIEKNLLLYAEPIFEAGVLKTIQGVIQQKQQSASEKEADEMVHKTLDNLDEMVFWINQEGYFTYANKSGLSKLGYDQSSFIRKILILKVAIEYNRLEWNRFRKNLESESIVSFESVFQRQNGTVFPVAISLLRLERGLICMMARDITGRRQEEARLQAALLQVQGLSRQLEAENIYLKEEVSFNFEEIVSKSPAYQDVLRQIEQVAPTNSTVLIEGETGTGKELLARAIHRLSDRQDRPLVKVNCAALSESLIESELFGHIKGAFTGADKDRIGRFELADRGTIFLDEIGELTPGLQVKLLRVLQEGELQRLGSNRTLSVDVRVIAATNRDLKKMVDEKKFREDLYYRLHVFPINNIPLRQRPEDITLLLQYFLEKYSKKIRKPIVDIGAEDLRRLKKYDFPGNVRELQNIIERAVILSSGKTLNLSFWNPRNAADKKQGPYFKSLEELQRDHIIDALERTRWRVSGAEGAARLLDVNPQTLFSRMRKLNINRADDLD